MLNLSVLLSWLMVRWKFSSLRLNNFFNLNFNIIHINMSYTDTIILEANRKSSVEFLGGNTESKGTWNNALGSGIKLDIGDTISVHSAYISEIGNEESTIEITGRKAVDNEGRTQRYTTNNVSVKRTYGEKNNGSATLNLQSEEGNYGWEYTQDTPIVNDIQDDEINMTHSYYKCNQGDNYITLPRAFGSRDVSGWYQQGRIWREYNASFNGAVAGQNPYRLGSDYCDVRYYGQYDGWGFNDTEQERGLRVEIVNDGSRFTLFTRKEFKNYVPEGKKTGFCLQGERDPAMMDFIWYKKTIKYNISRGFNSPANVATQFTNIMSDVNKVQSESWGDEIDSTGARNDGQIANNYISLSATSNTYERFPCATGWFLRSNAEMFFKDNYSNSVRERMYQPNPTAKTWDEHQNQLGFASANVFGNGGVVTPDTSYSPNVPRVTAGYKIRRLMNLTQDEAIPMVQGLQGATVGGVRDLKTHGGGGALPDMSMFTVCSLVESTTTYNHPNGNLLQYEFTNEHMVPWYDSCYSTVGFKRPEIQEAGRKLMVDENIATGAYRSSTDGSFATWSMNYPLSTHLVVDERNHDFSKTILTQIPWNDTNLLKLKTFIESQSLYPELFEYSNMSASQKEFVNTAGDTVAGENVSPDKMRFLHMNDKTGGSNQSVVVKFASWTETDLGGYLTVDDSSSLKIGMRLALSQGDTDNGARAFPTDTFITSKEGGNRLYLSNDYNSAQGLGATSDIYFEGQGLGSDQYYSNADLETTRDDHRAGAVFFDYNPDRADILEGEGNALGDAYGSLTYGFARRYYYLGSSYICFSVEKYQSGTLPQELFAANTISSYRSIGFDKHFNAYGTAAILLTNGLAGIWGSNYNASALQGNGSFCFGDMDANNRTTLPNGSETGNIFKAILPQPARDGLFLADPVNERFGPFPSPETSVAFNEIYCGANQPSLQFASDSSRFSFTLLHTPELVGTNALSTSTATDVGDATVPVYKINKRLSRLNYSPTFIPYNNVFKVTTAAGASGAITEKDQNTIPNVIMDAQSGIFIEDYGCDEANWTQSLWELLGFSYEQFHRKGSRLARYNNTGITSSTPTTNALVRTEDVQNFVLGGESLLPVHNTLEQITSTWRHNLTPPKAGGGVAANLIADSAFAFQGNPTFSAISQSCSSTDIIADNLPRKMLSPIFLIKTDLLNPQYIGGREGGVALPIIGVVDKSAGYGDFYTGAKDSTIFTNTVPRTVQNIQTSIVDADGTAARVDDSCCILYKITKQVRTNADVIENLLNPPKTPPK